MSESISIDTPQPEVKRKFGRRHPFFAVAALGLVIALLGLAITVLTVDVVRAALVSEPFDSESAPTYPRRELPREWQWGGPPAIEFEPYRSKKSDLDWIR